MTTWNFRMGSFVLFTRPDYCADTQLWSVFCVVCLRGERVETREKRTKTPSMPPDGLLYFLDI